MVAYNPANSRAAKAHDGAEWAPTETLNLSLPTPRQRMRQEAVLTATLELLHEFGFDGAKIQDIAGRSGVALATIYRYFGSRDCLIYEATLRWTSQIVMNARDLAIEESLD